MDEDFLRALDQFRGVINKPCVLTCPAYSETGHLAHSQHYLGKAVDCRFIDPMTSLPLSLKEHLIIAMRAPFQGVGIYTWSSFGPFLHLDFRVSDGSRKFWVSKSQDHYENISVEFLESVFRSES